MKHVHFYLIATTIINLDKLYKTSRKKKKEIFL